MIRCMLFECWIPKATNIHSEYAIQYLLIFHGNSFQSNATQCYIYTVRTSPAFRSLFQACTWRISWRFRRIGEKVKSCNGETIRPRHFCRISRLTFDSIHNILLKIGIGVMSLCFCQFEQCIRTLVLTVVQTWFSQTPPPS